MIRTPRPDRHQIDNANETGTAALRRQMTALLRNFRARTPLRGGSLIMTVFGDVLAPRGGSVWMSDLIELLIPFGLNDRLVRTAIFRLAQQEWLTAHRIGRRSYYSLTATGKLAFEEATRRIYAALDDAWDGQWTWVMLPASASTDRATWRHELELLGFGAIGRDVYAHPHPFWVDIGQHLRQAGLAEQAIVMRGQPVDADMGRTLTALARECWDMHGIERRYLEFIKIFRPVWQATEAAPMLTPDLAFQLRTLLIHGYRKVLLRDPHLPAGLLPPHWPGTAAFELCKRLYEYLLAPSEAFISTQLEDIGGRVPPADEQLYRRFGGLRRPS